MVFKIVLLALVVMVTRVSGVKRCNDVPCSSMDYRYSKCEIPPNRFITNVTLKYETSTSRCTEERFGVADNKIWVDEGCQGIFTYCYQTNKAVTRYDNITCTSRGYEYTECYVFGLKKINEISLVHQLSTTNCNHPSTFGININANKIWVDKGCSGVFRYGYVTDTTFIYDTRYNKVATYWGHDIAGSIELPYLESLRYYCTNFEYDVISISVIDMLYHGPNYRENLPGVFLDIHCSMSIPGYPDIPECKSLRENIEFCQERGKKITLSLRGHRIQRNFSNYIDAHSFALTIWNMFLGGTSDRRPFGDLILDGVDLDIVSGNKWFYMEFALTIKKLMSADMNRKFLITAAVENREHEGQFLQEFAFQLDHIYLKFFSKSSVERKELETIMKPWFKFAEQTKERYGKGPSVFISLMAYHRDADGAKYYIPPDKVQDITKEIVYNRNFGGVMIVNSSLDLDNKINGKYYSSYIREIVLRPLRTVCWFPREWNEWFGIKEAVCIVLTLLCVILICVCSCKKYRSHKKANKVKEKSKMLTDVSIEKVKILDEKLEPSSDGVNV